MVASNASASPLADLLPLDAYQERRANIFPGIESLRWYVRSNRADLNAQGALLYVAGRLWIKPEPFDRCVVDIGAKAAVRRKVAA